MQRYLSKIAFCYFPGGIKFSTTGICGGQIKVNYRNKWENVGMPEIPLKFKKKLCQELGCQGYDSKIEKSITKNKVIHLLNLCVFLCVDLCCIRLSKWEILSSILIHFSRPK